jgi:hypothetical protein
MPNRKEILVHLDEYLHSEYVMDFDDGVCAYKVRSYHLEGVIKTLDPEHLYDGILNHFGLNEDEDEDSAREKATAKWTSRRKIVDWLLQYDGQLDLRDEADGSSNDTRPNAWVVGNPKKTEFLALDEYDHPGFVKTIFRAEFFRTKKEAVRWIKSEWTHSMGWKLFMKTAAVHPVRIEILGE